MRVVIVQSHFSLNKKLAKEINQLAGKFNSKSYSKIENINNLLFKRDITIEKKKNALLKKLHELIAETFSINKKKFSKVAFSSLKKRIYNIRNVIAKLRSINYYLETTFLDELKLLKINMPSRSSKIKRQSPLARDELEVLEYTTYRLIEEAVMLDKKLLKEYASKQKRITIEEKVEVKDLGLILEKESELLAHLEAKLPPPKKMSAALIREPTFTRWAARIFALLTYLEHLCQKEVLIFSKLRKNKAVRGMVNKKISQLVKETSKLLKIMEDKAFSIRRFRMDSELKRELRNFTTTITL